MSGPGMRRGAAGRLGLLTSLYFSQGLPFGFFVQALPVLLREEGVSLEVIGLSSMLAIPWALKFLWAPWVDQHRLLPIGQRRGWILPLQLSAAALMLALAWLPPERGLWMVLTGVFLANLLAATQDIATDGLAVDMLSPDERGPANGLQVAGYRVGMIVGGGVLLMIFDDLGWTRAFLVMAGLLVVATVPIVLHRESPRRRQSGPLSDEARPWTEVFRTFLSRKGAGTWLLLLVLYKGPDAMASAMSGVFLKDLDLSLAAIGELKGIWGFFAGLLGALLGGWGVRWFGRRNALMGFGVCQSLAVGAYLLPAMGLASVPVLYAVVIIDTFAGGLATAALFTMMMDACRPDQGASDYTLQASVVVVATLGASSLSGFVAGALGYATFFAVTMGVTLVGLALVWIILTRGAFIPTPGGTEDIADVFT